MADRGHKAGKVVNSPDKDGAQDNPEESRQPPEPDSRQNRADHGAGGGNGGEVLTQQEAGGGGHIVDTIVDLYSGGGLRIIQVEPAGEALTVNKVRDQQNRRGEENDRGDHLRPRKVL